MSTFVSLQIRRVNIGGKLLTNFLKETLSYRQWNMMDEFLLVNGVKEQLCFVSQDVMGDLQCARRLGRAARAQQMRDPAGERLRKHFVLPDFQEVMKGYIKPDDELISANEQV
jgi:actin-related protein 6